MSEMKLAFMSWVCPDWTAEQMIEGAMKHGYQGVELVADKGHAHGMEKGTSPEAARKFGLMFREEGLEICALAAPCSFAMADEKERAAQVNELKAYITLAHAVGCGRVRVFGGSMPVDAEPASVVDYVADAISDALEMAEEARVQILVQTNDSFSHTPYLHELMSQLYSEYAGVLWDTAHPLRHFERVGDSYDNIADFIRHVHVHDITYDEDRTSYVTVPPGEGMLPLKKVVDLLERGGFSGYLSLEVMQGEPDALLEGYAKQAGKLLSGEEDTAEETTEKTPAEEQPLEEEGTGTEEEEQAASEEEPQEAEVQQEEQEEGETDAG